jgi:hypothetical protein
MSGDIDQCIELTLIQIYEDMLLDPMRSPD